MLNRAVPYVSKSLAMPAISQLVCAWKKSGTFGNKRSATNE